eukprot:5694703-Amphidinium_carterae.2
MIQWVKGLPSIHRSAMFDTRWCCHQTGVLAIDPIELDSMELFVLSGSCRNIAFASAGEVGRKHFTLRRSDLWARLHFAVSNLAPSQVRTCMAIICDVTQGCCSTVMIADERCAQPWRRK